MSTLSESEKKVISNIDTYGLHIAKVMEDATGPGFGYSIGLYKTYYHPEVIIICLNLDLIHNLINNIAEDIKDGKRYEAGNSYEDILDGFACYFTEVDKSHYNEYVGYGKWFYQNAKFPLLQCIYPTVKGFYPWQSEWPEDIKDLQPILGHINIQ